MTNDRFTSKTIPCVRNSRLKVSASSPPRESELFSIVCIEAVTWPIQSICIGSAHAFTAGTGLNVMEEVLKMCIVCWSHTEGFPKSSHILHADRVWHVHVPINSQMIRLLPVKAYQILFCGWTVVFWVSNIATVTSAYMCHAWCSAQVLPSLLWENANCMHGVYCIL